MSSRFASYFGGIGQVLAIRDYRLYWLGQLVSVQTVWIQRIAAGVLIYDLTQSPGWLGFVSFAYTVPLMVLGPFTGAFADRFGHRRTAIAGLVVGIVLTMTIAALTFVGLMTPWLLAALITAMGAQHAFDFPARQVLIQMLVGREHMSAAIALNSTTFNAAAFTGPAFAAALLAFGKAHYGVAGSSLGFAAYGLGVIWFAATLYMIHARDAARQPSSFGKLLSDVREGFVYIRNHETILTVSAIWIVAGFVIRSYVDLMPGYAESVFHVDEVGLGVLLAASGAGALTLSIFIAMRGRSQGLPRMFVISIGIATLALIAFTATLDFHLATAAMAVAGGFSVVASICAQTLIQSTVAQAMRARVIAAYLSLVIGAQSIGALSLGWIAEYVGLRWSVGGGAVVILLFIAATGPRIWRRAAEIEAEATGPVGPAHGPAMEEKPKAAE